MKNLIIAAVTICGYFCFASASYGQSTPATISQQSPLPVAVTNSPSVTLPGKVNVKTAAGDVVSVSIGPSTWRHQVKDFTTAANAFTWLNSQPASHWELVAVIADGQRIYLFMKQAQ